jgi:hypothetical protein
MRLLFERTKVFRNMALLELERVSLSGAIKGTRSIAQLIDASAADADLLQRLAQHRNSSLWRRLAADQIRRIQKLSADAGHQLTPDLRERWPP